MTDLQTRIDAQHIDAAMAWIRHATASVEAKLAQVLELSNRVLAFLSERGQATRSQIKPICKVCKLPRRATGAMRHSSAIPHCVVHVPSATMP